MKKHLYFLLLLSLPIVLFAQTSGGPDLYGYTWKTSSHTVAPPSYSWFDITTIGIPVTGLADDNYVGPFSCSGFQFYWSPEPQFWIGSNGYICFGPQNIASPFPASIPLSTGGNNFIAPFLGDLNFTGIGNTASCYYYANTDTICISFINVPFWVNNSSGYTGSNSFQIILNKIDKSITYNYHAISQGAVVTLDNIVGIENNTGNLGLATYIDVLPASLSSTKYYYPSTVTYAVTDGGMEWNLNSDNAGIFIESQGDSLQLFSSVKNFGNQALPSFTVLDTLYNSLGVPILNGSGTSSALLAGETDTVLFTNKFVASSPGTYSLNTSVSGISGDMVASNNRLQQELIAINTGVNSMTLDYSDGVSEGDLGWNGGNGGVGIYIAPPVYPVKVSGSRFNVSSTNSSTVGFHAMIYDDDGVNGGPGTLLDSVFVNPTTITLNVYTVVPTSNQNIIINDGGIYLLWLMDSAEIRINTDESFPISRRTYEVLSGGWAGYRSRLTTDFMMGLDIEHILPEAAFKMDWAQEPLLIFNDTSLYSPSSRLWDFGDGGTSVLENPSHTYLYNGTYNVCLTVTNPAGIDSICKSVTITKCPPVTKYNYDDSVAPTVVFTDSSVHNPISWQWDFDDNGAVSTLQNPTHTFTTNGIHHICLTASNSFGQGSTYCDSILISNVKIEDQNNQDNNVTVFPNPFSEQTTIEITSSSILSNLKLKCYNAIGEQVELDYNVSGNRIELNRGNLSTGVYLFEIYNENQKIDTGKFILK